MQNKININPGLIVYIVLSIVILAVYGQVSHFDFISLDDVVYVTQNAHIKSGITSYNIRWAFTTIYAGFWHPLTWLSLMLDYQLYGLHAYGYHLTNVILHIMSTLLLFWLFHRMTGAFWQSFFVSAFFALHPLRVESVAWIAERKDVLSGFFWMLTLCLYVFYTEKPAIRRYALVLFSFVLALMSKPIAVTLPLVMILLDYWPLSRYKIGIEFQNSNPVLWQLKEKILLFILSIFFSFLTFYAQLGKDIHDWPFPLKSRIINALGAFVFYLGKIFWPQDLAVCYPFLVQISPWQVMGVSLSLVVSAAVILLMKRFPYLFVGWFWYVIVILPVIGIIPVGNNAMADRYIYLPSLGISIMLAWGVPLLFKNKISHANIVLPAALFIIIIISLLTWRQCGYWKNNISLFSHAIQVTKDNHIAHNNLGAALSAQGKTKEAHDHFNEAIRIKPDYAAGYRAIENNNQGIHYSRLGRYDLAKRYYDEAIKQKPDYAPAYYNRGSLYMNSGQHQPAIDDFKKFLSLDFDCAICHHKIGIIYGVHNQYHLAIDHFSKAIWLKPDYFKAYKNRGFAYYRRGDYHQAADDYTEALILQPNDAEIYHNRSLAYFFQGKTKRFCHDAQKACTLGNCNIFEWAKDKGYCQ